MNMQKMSKTQKIYYIYCKSCKNILQIEYKMVKMTKLALIPLVLIVIQAQINNSCAGVACPTGFKCVEKVCLKEPSKPKKKLCKLNFVLDPIKCTNRNYKCDQAKSLASCGYTEQGLKKTFNNDCTPCLDSSIILYYKVSCNQAPIVCNQNEECVNGKCIQPLNDSTSLNGSTFKNVQSCISDKECPNVAYKCILEKCIKISDLIKQLQAKMPA